MGDIVVTSIKLPYSPKSATPIKVGTLSAKVFIDGDVGTTGLQIRSQLEHRTDLQLLRIAEHQRKDPVRRQEALNAADVAILCLPDDAARESTAMVENPKTKIIDTSTAHRISEGWTYGFPEYDARQRQLISISTRVSNPGCYAITSIAILHPLIANGLLPAEWPITINAVSGYSGGGKKLISDFENKNSADYTNSAFYTYGLPLKHKHVPEITKWSGLMHAPIFIPSVGRYRQGMVVQVPLPLWFMTHAPKPEDIHAILADHYAKCMFVSVAPLADSAAMDRLDPEELNGTNMLFLYIFANDQTKQAVIMGVIDNLGKGASGQAVQNMNIMLGLPEETGLTR